MLKPANHKILTIQDVIELGQTLIAVANQYPTRFLTERDFFPLVVTYLTGRVPSLKTEVCTKSGRIDFHLKGNNPTWLELAVQPRMLVDKKNPDVRFSGHAAMGCLHASQNRPELRKLIKEPKGRTRFILLVDFHGGYKLNGLKENYGKEASKFTGRSVRVIYVSPFYDPMSFSVKPKKPKMSKKKGI